MWGAGPDRSIVCTALLLLTGAWIQGCGGESAVLITTPVAPPEVKVGPISGAITEAGGQATFTVVLAIAPTADVTVNFVSNDTSEGTLSTASLTFTTLNWGAPQTVTVTGVDDALTDGNQVLLIVFSSTTSADLGYAGLAPAPLSVTNVDDEVQGVNVSPISGPVTESGGQATFTVVLTAQPAADVTLSFDSNDLGEGTLSATSLTFTAANWNAPQTATVTGVDDLVADGNQPFVITFSATTSADADYAAITPGDVQVTNIDDESPGILVVPIAGPTTEAGGQATFTIVLASQPAADVTLNFDSNDPTEGTVGVTSLLFTGADWNVSQTVVVTGVPDGIPDGDQLYAIVFSATTSADADYAAITPSNLPVTNLNSTFIVWDFDTGLQGWTTAGTSATVVWNADGLPTPVAGVDPAFVSGPNSLNDTIDELRKIVEGAGARFELAPVEETMLESSKPVVAVRTGCGKSQTTRHVAGILREQGKRVVAVRHPMPYGDLTPDSPLASPAHSR